MTSCKTSVRGIRGVRHTGICTLARTGTFGGDSLARFKERPPFERRVKRHVIAGGPWPKEGDRERCETRIAKAETELAKLAAAKRRNPDAQKIASQVGRTIQRLKTHKYFACRVDESGLLRCQRTTTDLPMLRRLRISSSRAPA